MRLCRDVTRAPRPEESPPASLFETGALSFIGAGVVAPQPDMDGALRGVLAFLGLGLLAFGILYRAQRRIRMEWVDRFLPFRSLQPLNELLP